MANIDLNMEVVFPNAGLSHKFRYARIDNIAVPMWVDAGIFAPPFPQTISGANGVPAGQYTIGATPVYPDGRICSETTVTTNGCEGLISLNATQAGTNLVITYNAPITASNVRILVNFPNGGSFDQIFANGNNNSTVTVPIPSGVYGDYTVYGQSVCDPTTNFYSELSNPVTVTIAAPAIPVLNATITAVDNGGTSSQVGSVSLSFVFNTPTTQTIQILAGYCGKLIGGSGYYCRGLSALGTTGVGPNNQGTTAGNLGWPITIPSGVTSYNTGVLLAIASDGSGPWSMDIYPTSNPNYPAITDLYLKVTSPGGSSILNPTLTNTDITLHMVG